MPPEPTHSKRRPPRWWGWLVVIVVFVAVALVAQTRFAPALGLVLMIACAVLLGIGLWAYFQWLKMPWDEWDE
ncbi:MAG: hypothetical protein CME89_00830 [Hirschia sp.]|nr:hypothetical protein [Hirschia sp.]